MAQLLLEGHPIGTIHGVLFDKDGTLSHSEPHLLDLAERRISAAVDLWSAARGTPTKDLRQILSRAFGLQNGALHPGGTLAVAARQDNLTSTATVFCLLGCSWAEGLALADRCFNSVDQQPIGQPESSPLMEHAATVIRQLHAGGVQLAVISNDTRLGIQNFLAHHAVSNLFSDSWSADDTPRKPDPEAVHQLCNRMNLEPEHCALIGDAETDLSMARQAGIGCVIGYRGGWTLPPVLPSAPHLLDNWRDLGLNADP